MKLLKKISKKMSLVFKGSGGRTSKGRITVRGRKREWQKRKVVIDSYSIIKGTGFVLNLKGKRKSRGFLGYIYFDLGFLSIYLLEETLKVGNKFNLFSTSLNKGDVHFLKNFNLGMRIFNIQVCNYFISRGAGTFCTVYGYIGNFVLLKANSGWLLKIHNNVIATLGCVSNKEEKFVYDLGKASERLKLGFRSKVRGVAMNPVDHPHGGGEGKKTPKVAKTPWGKLTKGVVTKRKKKYLKKKKIFKLI